METTGTMSNTNDNFTADCNIAATVVACSANYVAAAASIAAAHTASSDYYAAADGSIITPVTDTSVNYTAAAGVTAAALNTCSDDIMNDNVECNEQIKKYKRQILITLISPVNVTLI